MVSAFFAAALALAMVCSCKSSQLTLARSRAAATRVRASLAFSLTSPAVALSRSSESRTSDLRSAITRSRARRLWACSNSSKFVSINQSLLCCFEWILGFKFFYDQSISRAPARALALVINHASFRRSIGRYSPPGVWIISAHLLHDLSCLFPQVFFKYATLLIHEKSHHAGRAVIRGPANQGETNNHISV